MDPYFTELDGYGLSNRVWGKLAAAGARGLPSGNPVIGYYDDFLKVGNTSLYDGYIRLAGSGCSVAQITSEANHPGIVRISMDGTQNDEGVIQLGNGLDVGFFKFTADLAFEVYCRLSANGIVVNVASIFAGLASGGSAGVAITDKMFADTNPTVYATNDFVGFQHLYAETTALDAMYQATGVTKVDGAVNTDLDTIHTLVANTWVKLGFRYCNHPRKLTWYVDGEEVCSIGKTALDATSFPDAVFLQPTVGIKIGSGAAAVTLDIDWMACAQLA